jgi:hypothetical protein
MAKIPKGYRRIENSQRVPAHGAKRTGPADLNETLSVTVRVRRRTDAPPLPDPARIASTPVGERTFLSREDFAEHYGASPEELNRVAAFGREHGLIVGEVSIPKRTVVLSGTVEKMSKAFQVDLGRYESATETYRGREGHVNLPDNLADVVEGVFGLDNRKMAQPQYKMHKARAREATGGPAQGTVPLTPPHVAALYNFPTTPNAAGQTIGLFEFGGGYKLGDIQAFFNGLALPTPTLTSIGVDGVTNSPGSNDDVEVVLDIDVAGSAAPGSKIAVYFGPWTEKGWVDMVTTAVHDATNKPSVISISWGWPENETFGFTWTKTAIDAVNATFREAAAMGVSVLAASGDHGSDCGMGDGKPHVLYPASDPYVTACGGTSISNVSGSSFTEHTWNDNDNDWITGGGISDIFGLPAWQAWANVPGSAGDGHRGRGIPDIGGNADGASGYDLIINGNHTGAVGGTSATAPLYAGLVALLNAGLSEPLGYLNPNLYAFAGPYVYRDIADNISNARGGAPGYQAVPGWDACTGLGSVNGVAMENALRGVGLPPAMAVFNGKLFMVWKGMERDDRVFFSYFDGTKWAAQKQVPGIGSSTGVALAVFQNKLFMAWKGVLADERIFWTTFDGANWAPQQMVPAVWTSTGPRIAVLNNKVYMAWKGVEGDQRIFWTTFDGNAWAPQTLMPNVATSVGPALAVFNGVLYMAWKGWYGDQGIYWSTFNGVNWASQKQIPGVGTSEGPSLAARPNGLFAAWKGIFGDQSLWCSEFTGSSWTPQKQIPGVWSSVGPGIAEFGPELYAAWKGMLGDQRIWYSHLDGSTWAGQQVVPGVGTSPDLVTTPSA